MFVLIVWLWGISGGYSESDDGDAPAKSISVWRGCCLTSSYLYLNQIEVYTPKDGVIVGLSSRWVYI